MISNETTPVTAMDDSIRRIINDELWMYYFRQLNDFYLQFTSSEQDRILRLLEALTNEESCEIGGGDARNILSNEDLAEGELNADAIINRLLTGSFLRVAVNGYEFYSGLVPAWYRIKRVEHV